MCVCVCRGARTKELKKVSTEKKPMPGMRRANSTSVVSAQLTSEVSACTSKLWPSSLPKERALGATSLYTKPRRDPRSIRSPEETTGRSQTTMNDSTHDSTCAPLARAELG